MNCKDIEPDLALAASDCLDAARALEIRKHCANCPECASRLEQFQRVASDHRHAANELDGLGLRHEPSAARPGQGETGLSPIALYPVLRWLLPLSAAAAIAVGFFMKEQPALPLRTRMEPAGAMPASTGSVDRAPSLAAYRNALEQSGDASLDALLSRDADRLLRKASRQETRDLLSESF